MDLDDAIGRVARALMQAVDVLGDQCVQLPAALELDERVMPGVRRGVPGRVIEAAAPREPPHLGIGHVVVNVGELFGRRIARPDALRAPKIRDAGIGRDSRAGQGDEP